MTRKQIQDIYIRVCRDSQFTLDAQRAAILVGMMLNKSPLEVWLNMDINVMERVASGEHPAAHRR